MILGMKREETIQAINDKFTEMSTEIILLHQAVADTVGLYITDHQCMHFLHRYGAMPAGRLAELTGLTTGAAMNTMQSDGPIAQLGERLNGIEKVKSSSLFRSMRQPKAPPVVPGLFF